MENQTLVKEICPTTTQQWVKNGALLVDVREKDEVVELAFDVPNIINIPLSEFEERFSELPKNKEIVMVSEVGSKSLRAAGFLINHGYSKVVNMQHGLARWVQKGFLTKGNTASVNAQSGGCCGTSTTSTAQSCCDDSSNSNDNKCC